MKNAANWHLAFKKDGWLCYSQGDGGNLQKLFKNVDAFAWSQDGELLAFTRGDKVYLVRLMNLEVVPLGTLPEAEKVGDPQRSSDGEEVVDLSFDPDLPILVVVRPGKRGVSLISYQKEDLGSTETVLDQWGCSTNAAQWSATGRFLAFTRNGDIWIAKRGYKPTAMPNEQLLNYYKPDYYDQARRLAPLAVFNDAEIGVSAETPFWVDGLAWTGDESKLVYHFQRQGGSGVSEIGYLNLTPVSEDTWETSSGFRYEQKWVRPKEAELLYDPVICPDGKTLSCSWMNEDNRWHFGLVSWDGKRVHDLGIEADGARWRPGTH